MKSIIDEIASQIKPVSYYATGHASIRALEQIIQELTRSAPEDHDIVIETDNLIVYSIRYFEPHTFVLCGQNNQGDIAFEVLHYSQLKVRITHFPKKGPERRVVGFVGPE